MTRVDSLMNVTLYCKNVRGNNFPIIHKPSFPWFVFKTFIGTLDLSLIYENKN